MVATAIQITGQRTKDMDYSETKINVHILKCLFCEDVKLLMIYSSYSILVW